MNSISKTPMPLWGCLVAAIVVLASAASAAEAQTSSSDPETSPILHACYVPGSGVVYRISPDGQDPTLRDSCRSQRHVPFSWNAMGVDGADGADGEDGTNGFSCWDTNQNGEADEEEDRNGDGSVDVFDCLGEGTPGSDGEDGADGLACWDLNGNGVADTEEDVDGSGAVDALDCRGPEGPEGAEGPEGPDGPQGPAGPYQCRVGGPSPSSPFGEMGGTGVTPVPYAPARVDMAAPAAREAPRRGSEPFIGEIMLVGFTFAPRGWAFAEGQLLPIAQYSALFSLLGTNYGGDGRSTFGLPDMRGLEPLCGSMRWVIALQGLFPSRS